MTVLKARLPDNSWVTLGGVGTGVPPGGATGQVLTKKSATDYDTQWGTNQPILSNNTHLQGYRVDGTTPQSLIGIDASNAIIVASAAPAAIAIGSNAGGDVYLGYAAQGHIQIGQLLAAGKQIYVPRLTMQGVLTLQDQQNVNSSTGMTVCLPWSPSAEVHYAYNCKATFNAGSGATLFSRDVSIIGVLYKGGVAYTHPDFVFEHAYRGRIELFANATGASVYSGLPTLNAVEAHTREFLKLPGPRTDQYDLFARGDELLAEVEKLYLYLFNHERRLAALEK